MRDETKVPDAAESDAWSGRQALADALGLPACPDHGATARSDGACMVRGCRYARVTPPGAGA